MPGPAPSKNPRRRNARPDWRVLPAAGREGDTPPWPMTGRTTKQLRDLWADLWKTPQSVAWEALGWTRVVARYARLLIAAETMDAGAKVLLAEARQLEDRLGLTPMSMKRLQWEIGPPQILGDEEDEQGPSPDRPAKVSRLDEYRELYESA